MANAPEFKWLMKTKLTVVVTNPKNGLKEKVVLDAVFPLDGAGVKQPWSVLANYYAPKFITKKYGPEGIGWERIYERKIVKIVNRENPDDIREIPLRVLDMEQLVKFCEFKEIYEVNPYEFHTVEVARQMIDLRLADQDAYKKHLAEYRAGKKRAFPELDHLKEAQIPADAAYDSEFDSLVSTPKKSEIVESSPISDRLRITPEQNPPKKRGAKPKVKAPTGKSAEDGYGATDSPFATI